MSGYQPKRDASGFYLLKGPGPAEIWIESDRIEDCMAYYRKEDLSRIAVANSMGYRLGDLSFLREHPYVRGVRLVYANKIDISSLSVLGGLEYLSISDNKQPLDLAQFKRLHRFHGDWHPKLKLPEGDAALRVLSLRKYRSAAGNLSGLPWLARLEDLSIVQSQITSVEGVQNYKTLRRLELSYCTKLSDISQVAGLADGRLEILECEKCRKITNHWAVTALPRLRVLLFNACGETPSIKPIESMAALDEFRFVNTNVIDGDLRPLLRLKSVGFFHKKHYSHTPDEIDQLIADRSKD